MLLLSKGCSYGQRWFPRTIFLAGTISLFAITHGWSNDVRLTKLRTSHSFQMTESKQNFDMPIVSRRDTLGSLLSAFTVATTCTTRGAYAEEGATLEEVQVIPTGEARKLFNDGRALESQGNMAAAQRLYQKVTKMTPRFIYGWSNLGNTEVALGSLAKAEIAYSTAVDLCNENLKTEEKFGVPRCNDEYLILLNRGALRLNNNMRKEALADLQKADTLRGKPDAIILQNVARAKELNGMFGPADRDYTLAISMSSSEVNPFWLRSALVKYQLGEVKEGYDLLKRVENRFPDAPEVRAAYAVFLANNGDQIAAQRKYLEIPDRQRKNYVDQNYLVDVISWPPAMIDGLAKITSIVEKNE